MAYFQQLEEFFMRNRTVEQDLEWLCKHQEITQEYRGKYVAIIDEKVAAFGDSLQDVLSIAEKLDDEPLISFIPEEETLIL
jgi:hypothetical protein